MAKQKHINYHHRARVRKHLMKMGGFIVGGVALAAGAFYGSRYVSQKWLNAPDETQNYNFVSMNVSHGTMNITGTKTDNKFDTVHVSFPVVGKSGNYVDPPEHDKADNRARLIGSDPKRNYTELQIEQKNESSFREDTKLFDDYGDFHPLKDETDFDSHPPRYVFNIDRKAMGEEKYQAFISNFKLEGKPQTAAYYLGPEKKKM